MIILRQDHISETSGAKDQSRSRDSAIPRNEGNGQQDVRGLRAFRLMPNGGRQRFAVSAKPMNPLQVPDSGNGLKELCPSGREQDAVEACRGGDEEPVTF